MPTENQLLAWGRARITDLQREREAAERELERQMRWGSWNFLLARRALCAVACATRMEWCLEQAERFGCYDCLQTEWDRYHGGNRASDGFGVDGRVHDRRETPSTAC